MQTIKGFWQHENGEIYVIESTTLGKIVGGAGPIDPDNLRNLDEYDCRPAIVEWLERAVAGRKLHRIGSTA